jgi:signal transduction histidine kinase
MKTTTKQLLALSQATQAVTAYLDLDQVLERIVALASNAVGSDYTTVVLINEKGQTIKSAENISGIPPIEYRQREKGFTRWIIRHGRPLAVDKIGKRGRVYLGKNAPDKVNPPLIKAKVKSMIGLPLKGKKRLLGVLYFHSLRPKNFSEQLVLLTAFANQAAVAVENARLYEGLEKTVEKRTKKLTQLVRSQKEFIAHVGHELRTPLSIIKAIVESEIDSPSSNFNKNLVSIDKKVDLMSRILRNLMWISRLEIGQKSLLKTEFNLKNLLKEVIDDTFEEARKNKIEAEIKIDCPEKLQLVHDQAKIIEVLLNLTINAIIHSTGKTQVALRVKKEKDSLTISVEDNNPYIPKNELKKIFTPFYRSKKAKKTPGSGLGLYISQRLIELMEGQIWAERRPGRGNRFLLQLPLTY